MLKTFLIDLLRAVVVSAVWVMFMTVSYGWWAVEMSDAQARLWVFVTLVVFITIGTFLPKLVDRAPAERDVEAPF